jgi:hypothetical protein
MKLPATILLNSLICEHYPDIVERIKLRDEGAWVFRSGALAAAGRSLPTKVAAAVADAPASK